VLPATLGASRTNKGIYMFFEIVGAIIVAWLLIQFIVFVVNMLSGLGLGAEITKATGNGIERVLTVVFVIALVWGVFYSVQYFIENI
jgi:hypothetical protein